jgi:peptidoglycan/xylan/chitin deacetylase (PgdA/CDA1 family)
MKGIRTNIKSRLNKVVNKYHKIVHGSCAVLLYHRVTTLESDPQLLSVTPQNFDAQMKWLKQHYNVLTVSQFNKHIKYNHKFPENSVLLTFDDGYADNLHEALPILEKHDLQALFYIATATLNTSNEYWWDAVERILLLNGKDKELYEKQLPILRVTPPKERDKVIMQWARDFGGLEGRESHRALTFFELKKMSLSKSAVIGAHTHWHPSLAALSAEEQKEEIYTSVAILEEMLKMNIKHFSFPFGTKQDYNEDTLDICKEMGFDLVAANYPELTHCKSNPMHFPRFLVRDWKVEEFEQNLQSFFK